MAKPKEDGCCSRCLSCLGSGCIDKLVAMSSVLIKKLLMMGRLLAFVGGTLVKESLATSGHLVVVSNTFVKEA
jgi:hypothetical protein